MTLNISSQCQKNWSRIFVNKYNNMILQCCFKDEKNLWKNLWKKLWNILTWVFWNAVSISDENVYTSQQTKQFCLQHFHSYWKSFVWVISRASPKYIESLEISTIHFWILQVTVEITDQFLLLLGIIPKRNATIGPKRNITLQLANISMWHGL